MKENDNLLEKFNKIKFLDNSELEKLDFYELALYYDSLNNLENDYDNLTPKVIEEA